MNGGPTSHSAGSGFDIAKRERGQALLQHPSDPLADPEIGNQFHVFIADASTAGNILYHGALTASKAVGANDTFQIAANDLDITLD